MSTMSCVDVAGLLDAHADGRLPAAQRAAMDEHLAACSSCGHAWDAVQTLRAERRAPAPRPRPQAFERAMRATAARAGENARAERTRGRFWLGAAVGGALAAGLAIALVTFTPIDGNRPPGNGIPELRIALNETRAMNVAIQSARSVSSARIHVTVSGAVALAGYDDVRELSWTTELDSGVNMLTLPVRLYGAEGGSVRVQVSYDDQHKTFDVNVPGEPDVPGEPADPTV